MVPMIVTKILHSDSSLDTAASYVWSKNLSSNAMLVFDMKIRTVESNQDTDIFNRGPTFITQYKYSIYFDHYLTLKPSTGCFLGNKTVCGFSQIIVYCLVFSINYLRISYLKLS